MAPVIICGNAVPKTRLCHDQNFTFVPTVYESAFVWQRDFVAFLVVADKSVVPYAALDVIAWRKLYKFLYKLRSLGFLALIGPARLKLCQFKQQEGVDWRF